MADPDPRIAAFEAALANLITQVGQLARAMGLPTDAVVGFSDEVRKTAESLRNATSVTDGFFRLLDTQVGQYAQLIFRLNALNSSVYGATGAFTSILPAVTSVSDGFKKLTEFTGKAAGILGQTFGSIISRPLQLFSAGLDFATEALKFQIESSQKVADAFLELSKVGATFAASIGQFYSTASTLGIPIQTFSKIVTTNAANIAALGLGMQTGGAQVAEFTSNIVKSGTNLDDSLISLYGSLEALSEGVSDYMALQAATGVNIKDNVFQERLKSGVVSEYLLRQKELTTITGQTAKSMKEEEEKRRQALDYQLKVSRLTSEDARNNLSETMALAGKFFGPDAAKVAEELFATGGKLMSKSSLEYASANSEQVKAMMFMIDNINRGRTDFRNAASNYFKAAHPALMAEAKMREDIAEAARASGDPLLQMMSRSAAAVLANSGAIINYEKAVEEAEEARRKAEKEGLDAQTNAFVQAIKSNLETQRQLDTEVMKNMRNMNQVTQAFGLITRSMVAFQGQMFGIVMNAFNILNTRGGDAVAGMSDVFRELMRRLREYLEQPGEGGPPPASNPPSPSGSSGSGLRFPGTGPTGPRIPNFGSVPNPSPDPRNRAEGNARGGVVTEPTLVGEAGAERLAGDLVFPYDRPVPIAIDWAPMIAAIQEGNMASRELVSQNEDLVRLNRQLLDAVS